jgi:hypothetical protein
MKLSVFVVLIFILFSCDSIKQKAYLESCDNLKANHGFTVNVVRTQLPVIHISPKHFKRRAAFSVLEKNDNWYICETSKNDALFTIYDMKNGVVLKHESLKVLNTSIGVNTFKSFDSIYFQLPIKGRIIRFDSSGRINENIDMSGFKLDWMMDDAPFGLHNEIEQGEILFRDNGNRWVFSVDAFDFWLYPDKTFIKPVVEYELSSNQIVTNIAERENYLTKGNFSLHDKYTYPFMAIVDEHLFLSYPFDHQVYKYDLATKELTMTGCMSSVNIKRLPDPLKKSYSTQESINFQLSSPHYGQINFHEDLNLFTRLVFHENELHDSDGNINLSTCTRMYSLLVFDIDLNLINEVELGSQDLWNKALAVSSGFLLSGKCDTNNGDDFFKYNYYYELVKK